MVKYLRLIVYHAEINQNSGISYWNGSGLWYIKLKWLGPLVYQAEMAQISGISSWNGSD